MTRGFTTKYVHVDHWAAQESKRADAACTTLGFYTGPTTGQTIDASSPLNISWISSCITTSTVDIYLFAPGDATPLVHEWENVPNTDGSYLATLEPAWWNSNASTNLQLSIVQSGTPVFLSPAPAGPVFAVKATGSTASSSSSSSSGSDVTDVQKLEAALKGMAPGQKAAAILLPLLFLIGLGAVYYFRVNHKKTQEKSKRFSAAVDKRMSTMSVDWKPMSAAGANAAIRASMAGSNRASVFSFGALRPSSELANDGGHAGVGAGAVGMFADFGDPAAQAQMSQLRSGPRPISTPVSQTRTSRVSFATDTRPSVDRRTIVSRAYHNAFVPPVPTPARQNSSSSEGEAEMMSPTQTQGPFSLSQEDINARVSESGGAQTENMDYMPALNMMRTGGTEADEYFIPRSQSPLPDELPSPYPDVDLPAPPAPAAIKAPVPMSPDEMLRAYAATRSVASPPGSPAPSTLPLAFPSPVAANGMRVLYAPATPSIPSTPVSVPGSIAREMHHAYAYNQEEDGQHEDAYGGTA